MEDIGRIVKIKRGIIMETLEKAIEEGRLLFIEQLDLPQFTKAHLKNRGVVTMEDLYNLSAYDFLRKNIYGAVIVRLQRAIGEWFYENRKAIAHRIREEEKNLSEEERTKEVLFTEIDQWDLSTRSTTVLENYDVRTVGDLIKLTKNDLIRYKNFGKKSLNEIQKRLAEVGLKLKEK